MKKNNFSIFEFIFTLWMSDREIGEEVLVSENPHYVVSKGIRRAIQQQYKNTPPRYRKNRDIPASIELFRNGNSDNIGFLELFGNKMDNVDFRERCQYVENGKRLYRLEMKHKDERPWHVRIEVLMKKLNCTYREAFRLSEAFTRLRLGKEEVVRIIKGYVKDNLTVTSGLKSVSNLEQYIQKFEALVAEMQPFEDQENSQYGLTHNDDEEVNIDFDPIVVKESLKFKKSEIAIAMAEAITEKMSNMDKSVLINNSYADEYEIEADPELEDSEYEDLDVDGNPFTGKELGMPEWSLPDAMVQYIRTSNQVRLNKLKKELMDPSWQSFIDDNGTKKYYKFHVDQFLTKTAYSELWERIKARDKELVAIRKRIVKEVSENGAEQDTIEAIETYNECLQRGSLKQAKFVLRKYINGGSFTIGGRKRYVKPIQNVREKEYLVAILKDEIAA